ALAFPFLRVESLLEELEDLLLARRLVALARRRLARLTEFEDELEPAPCHVVEGVGEQVRVLRLAGEVEVELRTRRELERERVAAQLRGVRLAQQRRSGDSAALFDGRQHGSPPGLL